MSLIVKCIEIQHAFSACLKLNSQNLNAGRIEKLFVRRSIYSVSGAEGGKCRNLGATLNLGVE